VCVYQTAMDGFRKSPTNIHAWRTSGTLQEHLQRDIAEVRNIDFMLSPWVNVPFRNLLAVSNKERSGDGSSATSTCFVLRRRRSSRERRLRAKDIPSGEKCLRAFSTPSHVCAMPFT
jgi:hypothetical protein